MMEFNEFIEKINKIIPEEWELSEEKSRIMVRNNQEFIRSLDAYIEPDRLNQKHLKEIDRKFLFLRYISGIETLVMDINKKSRDEFSLHSAWLLGLNYAQRERIQNHLGTLYRVRNHIIHSLSLPQNDKNFNTFFDSNFDKAAKYASEYHRLIMLRCINRKRTIVSISSWIKQLRELKMTLYFDFTPSLYQKEIAKKIEEITEVPSPHIDDYYRPFELPPKEERYFLGIDTYGGLSTITHTIIGDNEDFYRNGNYLIPEKIIWCNICKQIDEERRKIERENFNEVIIVPKTHLSFLFYLGYRFWRVTKPPIFMNFKSSPVLLKPMEEFTNPSRYWQIRTENLNNKNTEVIIILNITHFKDDFVKENLADLNLLNLPILIFNYRNLETGRGVDSQSIVDKKDIYKACRAVERYLIEQKNLRLLRRIHLFSRAPASMLVLLGMHFHLQSLHVTLYEFGRKVPEEEEKYHKVIECR